MKLRGLSDDQMRQVACSIWLQGDDHTRSVLDVVMSLVAPPYKKVNWSYLLPRFFAVWPSIHYNGLLNEEERAKFCLHALGVGDLWKDCGDVRPSACERKVDAKLAELKAQYNVGADEPCFINFFPQYSEAMAPPKTKGQWTPLTRDQNDFLARHGLSYPSGEPARPSQPSNLWNEWQKLKRVEIRAQHEDWSGSEILTELQRQWGELDGPGRQADYRRLSQAD